MNGFRRKLALLRKHPHWALAEAAGRIRTRFAPRSGKRLAMIGPIRFEFDFDMGPGVRKMHAGAYEIEIVALMRELLRPGDAFVDVGANIGYLSSVAAACVGRTGRVLSFEPAPRCFRHLAATRAANPDYPWDVYQIGLGSEPGSADLAVSAINMGWNTLVRGQIPADLVAETVRVDVRRLDDCLGDAGVDRVRLLKVDVEGYEGAVLFGAQRALREQRIENLIVEMSGSQYATLGLDLDRVLGFLDECGYAPHAARSPHGPVARDEIVDLIDIWFHL